MIFGDGSVYEGQFEQDYPNGQGTFQYVNKDRYVGLFVDGRKQGRGTYYFS